MGHSLRGDARGQGLSSQCAGLTRSVRFDRTYNHPPTRHCGTASTASDTGYQVGPMPLPRVATTPSVPSSVPIGGSVSPEAYIADVLLRIADTPASRIDELLPAAWKPAAQAKQSSRVG